MPHALTSRVVRLANRTRLVFRLYSTLKRLLTQMGNGFLLKSHNGAHCCGTVGDSHSHSQLSTAKCTFTGNSSMELRYKGNTFFRTTCIIGEFFVNLQTNGRFTSSRNIFLKNDILSEYRKYRTQYGRSGISSAPPVLT